MARISRMIYFASCDNSCGARQELDYGTRDANIGGWFQIIRTPLAESERAGVKQFGYGKFEFCSLNCINQFFNRKG